MTAPGTLLGFDFGLKRIGIAVGQGLTRTATPLATLRAMDGEPDWAAVTAVIETWRPQALIVGLPRNMDGGEHALAAAARGFGRRLEQRYGLPVHWIDERLSSREAEQQLAASGRPRRLKGRKGDIDKVAAQIILQTWLSQHPSG